MTRELSDAAKQALATARNPIKNTDREIWREKPGDYYYSPSIHVTQEGGIGIDVGGRIIVMDVRDWHGFATRLKRLRAAAERVCWFDWSNNDDDAVSAVEALRAALKSHS